MSIQTRNTQTAAPSATLLAFPRPRAHIGAALKRHRLPEALAAALARESEGFAEVSAHAALAYALDQRIKAAPLDLERAQGILLSGPAGPLSAARQAWRATTARWPCFAPPPTRPMY